MNAYTVDFPLHSNSFLASISNSSTISVKVPFRKRLLVEAFPSESSQVFVLPSNFHASKLVFSLAFPRARRQSEVFVLLDGFLVRAGAIYVLPRFFETMNTMKFVNPTQSQLYLNSVVALTISCFESIILPKSTFQFKKEFPLRRKPTLCVQPESGEAEVAQKDHCF